MPYDSSTIGLFFPSSYIFHALIREKKKKRMRIFYLFASLRNYIFIDMLVISFLLHFFQIVIICFAQVRIQ